jgi:hypothetical protein
MTSVPALSWGVSATIVRVDPGLGLQRIHDAEINVRVGWLWDGGVEVRLGDELNGFLLGGQLTHNPVRIGSSKWEILPS